MNYMLKVSDEDLTILRKFELATAFNEKEAMLKDKFSLMFENSPNDVDYIEIYCRKDTKDLKKQIEDAQPKAKPHIEVKKPSPKKKNKENEFQLTDEEVK